MTVVIAALSAPQHMVGDEVGAIPQESHMADDPVEELARHFHAQIVSRT